jgi:hypothetical protein
MGSYFQMNTTSPKNFINEFSDEKDAIKIESLVGFKIYKAFFARIDIDPKCLKMIGH